MSPAAGGRPDPAEAGSGQAKPAVGVIGAGAMGLAMARNLHARGWPVGVRDILPAVERSAREAVLAVHPSARALAEACEVAVVVVVDAAQVETVLFGPDGVAGARGGATTVLLCATIAPQDTQRLADRLAGHGIAALDAPISGGPARALDGSMSMMLAGPPDLLARWQDLLADLAARRFVIGPVAGAEALALAARIGLDPAAMFEVIRASSGASWVFEDRMARALAEDYLPPRAAARILTKDVGLATALAAGAGQPTPLADAALARLRETVQRGWGDLDDAAVIKTYRP